MNLPVETLRLIQETAQRAQQPLPVGITDPRNEHFVIGGEHKIIPIPPADRDHQVGSLQDLINYVVGVVDSQPVIWHAVDGVCLVIDDADRRDRVTFPLTASEQAAAIKSVAGEPLKQAALIRLLRFQIGADPLLIDKFRRLDWSHSTEGRAEVRHGKESLGKDIEAKVQGVDELPEEIIVEIPLYTQQGERDEYAIRLGIDIDAVNQNFRVSPLPGELQSAIDSHQDSIRSRLGLELAGAEVPVPIYYGSP